MTHEPGLIQEIYATGMDVHNIVEKIEPVLAGLPRGHVLIALMTMAIIIQHPEITPEQLQEGVKGLSQWMALFLSTTDESGETPKELLN